MNKNGESFGKFGDIDFAKLDISQIIKLRLTCETKEDASEVLKQYEKYCDTPEIAHKNLGYNFGYCNTEDRKKLYSLFTVDHPIFGHGFGRGSDPSPEDTFKIGENMGDKINEGMKNIGEIKNGKRRMLLVYKVWDNILYTIGDKFSRSKSEYVYRKYKYQCHDK